MAIDDPVVVMGDAARVVVPHVDDGARDDRMPRRGDHLLKQAHIAYGVGTDPHPDRLVAEIFEFRGVLDAVPITQSGIEPCSVRAETLAHVIPPVGWC